MEVIRKKPTHFYDAIIKQTMNLSRVKLAAHRYTDDGFCGEIV